MERSASILIAGAGPTGLAAAIELVRRGFTPRIIDRDAGPTPVDQSRALAVLPSTLRILEASGLTPRIIEAGQRLERARIFLGGRRLADIETGGAAHPYPFIVSLPQGATERLMIDWLAAKGIEVEWNTGLTGLSEGSDAVTATLSSGESMTAAAVIGCDGSHSIVRSALGIDWTGAPYEHEFALADLALSQPIDATRVEARLDPRGGATAIFPLGPKLVRVVGMARRAEETIEGFPSVERVVWRSQFTVSFRHAERMAKGCVFLAGDAAHVHSPVGARGMNLGIADAATLAFLFENGQEADYEAERLPVARRVLRFTHAMTDRVMTRSAIIDALLRFLLPAAASTPLVRRRLAERLLGLDLEPSWLR